jgi:uncharacterized membrane protein YozB (DUF420 family)
MSERTTAATISSAAAGTVHDRPVVRDDLGAHARHRTRVDSWFYIGVAMFVLFLNVAGFGPSLLDRSMRNGPPSRLVIIHGVVAVAWLLLFLAQATLVATRRTSMHRRLGAIAPALAVLMVALVIETTLEMLRRGNDLSGDLFRPLAAPGAQVPSVAEADGGLGAFVAALTFGILVAAGWWHRRRPQIHKRLMLVALLSLTGTPLLHLGGYVVGQWPELLWPVRALPLAGNLLLFAGAAHDKITTGRVHPISLWVPLAIIVATLFTLAVSLSAPWRQFAAWLAG